MIWLNPAADVLALIESIERHDFHVTEYRELIVHEDGPTDTGLVATFEQSNRPFVRLQVGFDTAREITQIGVETADELMMIVLKLSFDEVP